MTDRVEFPVVESPLVPPGRVYLVPSSYHPMVDLEAVRLRVGDLWDPAPAEFTDAARRERLRALDQLETLLDVLCERVGLDPWTAWRVPRELERAATQVRVETRAALSVLRPDAPPITTITM